MNKYVYAIDFGTSNSLISIIKDNKVESILEVDKKNNDSTILRSIMYFPKNGESYFGQEAIDNYIEDEGAGRFIRSIKKYLPIESFTGTQINNQFYSIENLISRFLKEMKKRADDSIGVDVKKVLLGRPAKFSSDPLKDKLAEQRLLTAARVAGFTEVSFCAEPLAAAYEFKKTISDEKTVLVADLGGGTSDFTVIKIHPGLYSEKDVLSMGGLSVAGNKLDGALMGDHIAPFLGSKVKYKMPMSENVLSMPASIRLNLMSPADIVLMSRKDIMKFLNEVKKCTVGGEDQEHLNNLFALILDNQGFSIYEEIEKCKRSLCETHYGEFNFVEGDIDINKKLSYEQFLSSNKKNIDMIFEELSLVLTDASLKPSDIDLICCTGGTSKVPDVKNRLEVLFGPDKVQSFKNFHSVIQGLAEKAATLSW